MNAKSFLLFLLFLSLVSYGIAQRKGIYLIDSISKSPIRNAAVQSENLTFNELSDENGFVNLLQLPENASTLLISCVGFQTQSLPLTFLENTKTPIVYLKPKVASLAEIQIQATKDNQLFNSLNAIDIQLRPITNSQDVLRMVPGLFIGQHAGGGKAEQLFIRGFDLDHGTDINISVDGIPVNMVSHAHGQGYADLHFVIPELIQQVDFNKGPYFADKGNFTTAGFVAFKTKDYLEKPFVKVELGQFQTYRTVAGFNLLKPKTENPNKSLYFAGEGSFSNGFFTHPQNFNRFNGILKYKHKLNATNFLSAAASGFYSQWNASGQIPERAINEGLIGFYGAIDPNEGGKTKRYNGNIELLSYLNNGAKLRNQVFYSKYAFELYSNFTFFKIDSVNGDQIKQKENRDLIGYTTSYVHNYTIGKFKSETKTGLQFRYDAIHDIELSRTKDRTLTTNSIMRGDVHEMNLAYYYSQRIELTSKLTTEAALRIDNFSNRYKDFLSNTALSTKSAIILPKLNVNYTVNKQVALYLYNGRGFHSNDTRVAVLQQGKKVLPPAYGSDLGGVFKIGSKLIIQTALWYLWLDQEFVYVGDEGIVEAGGKTQRFGIDFSTRYELGAHVYADLDLSLAKANALNVAKTESYLPLAPLFTSIGGISYQKNTGWNGSLRYRYMANRPANETNSVVAKGYLINDITVNYKTKKWQAGLSIQNLLNTKWKETQFDTESRLQNETAPVSEIHFTPGSPFFARLNFTLFL